MDASILLVARDQPRVLWAQIESLVAADLGDRVEVVIVDDASGPEVRSLLDRLAGDVTIRRTAVPVGRRAALALGAEAARGDVCIALAPTSRPRPGFVEPLRDAVLFGAPLAVPLVETAAGIVAGYGLEPDGSLSPLLEGAGEPPDAPSLDCIAARPELFASLPPFSARSGHYETHVADAAGGVVVAAGARVARAAVGPAGTVVVSTRNRAEEAAACVGALAAAGALADGCEVVVVDNGSRDDTVARLRELSVRLGPRLRVVEEPVPGLSRARNAGAAAAATPLLFYLDDDARPAPGWLEALRDCFVGEHVVAAGGPIHGLWPAGTPEGFPPPGLEGYFSILDWGDVDTEAPQTWHYGANWAVRRSALLSIGGFDEQRGQHAGSRLDADETETGFRLARARLGHARHSVAAAVGHRIGRERLDPAWLLVHAYRRGCLLPEQATAFRGVDAAGARELAGNAAAALVPYLGGDCDAAVVLDRIAAAGLPLSERIAAAQALGALVAASVALGAERCAVGGGVLHVSAPAAAGFVEAPRAAAA